MERRRLFFNINWWYYYKTCHKWTNISVNKDFDEFTIDERGGKRGDSFWDCYPDSELEAKQFVYQECSKTEAAFTVETLARFVDQRFDELNNLKKIDQQLVRSVESCRLDLRRFGVKFTANSSRSYFLGHEREDVVKHRQEFVKYFIEREQHFYTITNDAVPQGRIPTTAQTILLYHDESTYKCGEITAKRWIMPDNAPFYNKGRGRSIMCSDLLVMHPSGPFFSLTEKEYSEALKTYPNLNDDCDINYEKNSASTAIALGGDNYFDNQSILNQFKRLFQLLPFKKEYKSHNFLYLVENSRTHTAAEIHLNDFRMRPGTRCPVDKIEYIDENNKKKLSNVMMMMDTVKVSKLEKLAAEYNIKIIFTPKYHCETNLIEGYWCHSKQYIRKHTDQSFQKLTTLMPEAKANFIQKQVHLKLFRRFWRTIKAYDQGKDYLEVLRMFFSGLCNDQIISHRKITNTNLDN
ncbi:unnamed protein product [Rotaria socialis]|uniref:Tc1-like transposase DDE domain-containing protein n=1 Tax=Rotaria socialis TaxID=392032 RepID=A0A821S2X7_9BILA|nr:unnamed protein product [Rotaria socialis]CAF4851703.1 unnamed protein product [Rotaria socialis]